MNHKNKNISIIIPCYNEESNIEPLYKNIVEVLPNMSLEIIFVDDGSSDQSLLKIKQLSKKTEGVKYISFSRNFGHQKALMAGLYHATGDAVVSMDADMQHPAEVIPELIKYWEAGFDIVYTIRKDQKLPFVKKMTASLFYKIINKLSDVPIEKGTADFRLLDRKVVDVLKQMRETHTFYRGLIPWVGFKSKGIEYLAQDRLFGNSKYTFRKMMNFAIDGLTSFSTKPLRVFIYIGFTIALLAFVYGLYAIYSSVFTNQTISGWGSTISVILFIGGLQLIILGVIAEYVGKIYLESKNRPNYIIKEQKL